MIRVKQAPEPADFDQKVRQMGARALAEMTGQPHPFQKTKRKQLKTKSGKLITRPQDIPSKKIPTFWTEALNDLLTAYDRICAYLCLYIPRGTGAASVDHMVPKSLKWDRVYEWDNYRLACSLMNSRKSDMGSVLDPFEVEDGWFQLELTEFQPLPNPTLDDATRARVQATITQLKLDDEECNAARRAYAEAYWDGDMSLNLLTRQAPFVARELRRQGRLRAEDDPELRPPPSTFAGPMVVPAENEP